MPREVRRAGNKLFFRAEDVSQPFITHNPEPKQQLLAGQKPRLEDVAVEMRVSARAMQRRLLG